MKEIKWETISSLAFLIPPIIMTLIICVPLQIHAYESEIGMDVLCVYNDDPLMSVSNVHYREEARNFDYGFPDFWNIKKVTSFVSAEYPDGSYKYYTVVTNVETMEYIID